MPDDLNDVVQLSTAAPVTRARADPVATRRLTRAMTRGKDVLGREDGATAGVTVRRCTQKADLEGHLRDRRRIAVDYATCWACWNMFGFGVNF